MHVTPPTESSDLLAKLSAFLRNDQVCCEQTSAHSYKNSPAPRHHLDSRLVSDLVAVLLFLPKVQFHTEMGATGKKAAKLNHEPERSFNLPKLGNS